MGAGRQRSFTQQVVGEGLQQAGAGELAPVGGKESTKLWGACAGQALQLDLGDLRLSCP